MIDGETSLVEQASAEGARVVPPQPLARRLTPGRAIGTDPTATLNFELGQLDVLGIIAAALIARGLLPANTFDATLEKHSEFWRAAGIPSRAAPGQILSEVLADAKRDLAEAAALRVHEQSNGRLN